MAIHACAVAGLVFSQLSFAAADTDWPEFRGPTGQGQAIAANPPLEWSTTRNVVWKTALPGIGWSSPVIGGGRIFLTTGVAADATTAPSLRAIALDAGNGRVLWNTEVFAPSETRAGPMHDKNSPASPTPIVEGDRLYVHFGFQGTACLDRSGKILWRNNHLTYNPVHGNGGSPILVDDKLIFHADGAHDPFAVALDKNTGGIAWKAARSVDVRQTFSFCTPLLITVEGRREIISPASGAVLALDPLDGRELWRVRYGRGYSVVPRPVYGVGLVFVATGFDRADLLAIRPEGAGDLTDTNVVWKTTKGAPLTPSVVLVGDELYAVNDAGLASCFDAKTGTLHWQERIEGNYSASPLAAAGRIYFQNETGTGTVLAAGRKFKVLATNQLEERTLASYAVADESFFIRTEKNLYRIAENRRTKAKAE